MTEITEVLQTSLNTFFNEIAAVLPSILGAVVILIFGWIIAKLVKAASIRLMKLVRLNVVTEKASIDKFLADGGVQKNPIEIIGGMFYWLILLVVFVAAFNTLGLSVASELMNQIVLYIPNIIVSVFVLIFGLFLANFVSQIVVTYAKNIGIEHAGFVGTFVRYAIIIFVISMSLAQLNIGKEIVTSAFLLIFGAVCLALALAFGLGGREWAAKFIEENFSEKVS